MNFVKDDTTAQLDEAMALADETIDLYRDLAEHLEDAELRADIKAAIEEHERLLHALRRNRQARDDLPQAGDPERAHLRALLAEAQALLKSVTGRSEGANTADWDHELVQTLAEATRHLHNALKNASRCDLPASELDLVERYRQSCENLEDVLRKRS